MTNKSERSINDILYEVSSSYTHNDVLYSLDGLSQWSTVGMSYMRWKICLYTLRDEADITCCNGSNLLYNGSDVLLCRICLRADEGEIR